jgi:hypothetical protein
MAHDVFLSYSSKDKFAADAACAVLERYGIRVWMAPRDILPGMEWGASIIAAINTARVMVLVFSGNANESKQVRLEVERAINKSLPVIPFRIEDVEPSAALELFISASHWLDAFTKPMEQHLDRLAEVVRRVIEVRHGCAEPSPAADTANQLQKKLPLQAQQETARRSIEEKWRKPEQTPLKSQGTVRRRWLGSIAVALGALIAAGGFFWQSQQQKTLDVGPTNSPIAEVQTLTSNTPVVKSTKSQLQQVEVSPLVRKVVYNVALMEGCRAAYNYYIDGNSDGDEHNLNSNESVPPNVSKRNENSALPTSDSFRSLTGGMNSRGPFDIKGVGQMYIYDKAQPIKPSEGACGNYIYRQSQVTSPDFDKIRWAFEQMQGKLRLWAARNVAYFVNKSVGGHDDELAPKYDGRFETIVSLYEDAVTDIANQSQPDAVRISSFMPQARAPDTYEDNDSTVRHKVAPAFKAFGKWINNSISSVPGSK